jgi:hypothetical protein
MPGTGKAGGQNVAGVLIEATARPGARIVASIYQSLGSRRHFAGLLAAITIV